jgi:hypothetical protein
MDLYISLFQLYLIYLLLVSKYIAVALFYVICLELKFGRFKRIFPTLRACLGEPHSNFSSASPQTPYQTRLAPGTLEKNLELEANSMFFMEHLKGCSKTLVIDIFMELG